MFCIVIETDKHHTLHTYCIYNIYTNTYTQHQRNFLHIWAENYRFYMQQRTKCNINWQIEGPETPKRTLHAKKGGRKEGLSVRQFLVELKWYPGIIRWKGKREKKYCDGTNGVACIWVCCVQTRRQVFIARMRIMWEERARCCGWGVTSGGSYFAYFSFKYFDVCT